MNVDYILTNGHILSMAENQDNAEIVVLNRGSIEAIGGQELLDKYEGKIIDLNGKTVLPGFYDSHMHLVSTFLSEVAISFENASCIQDILDMISEYRRTFPDRKIIYGRRLSEFQLKERRMPTKQELDKVAANVPVIISSIEFHTVVLNSYALHIFGIPFTIPYFEKDADNRFTGRIRNRGSFIARRKMFELLSDEMHIAGRDQVVKRLLKKGVTTVTAVEGGSLFHEKHVPLLMDQMKQIPIDVNLFYSTVETNQVMQYKLPRIGGDIFLDGSFRSHNAAVFESYEDLKGHKGTLFFNHSELKEFIQYAHELGLQIGVHAVGGRGIELLLDVYEAVLKERPKEDHRHRIEHFELPNDNQIKRAADLGLVLAMHPTYELFFRGDGDMYDTRLGKQRSLRTNPFRKIMDSGIVVAGSSDSDIMPSDPILGVHAAVNHPNKASQITVYEALKMYTVNGAYASFEEKEKGTLERGKKADLIVLNQDIMTVLPEKIREVEVAMTFKNGQLLYTRVKGDSQ